MPAQAKTKPRSMRLLQSWVTPKTFMATKAKATKEGMSISAYVRWRITGKKGAA